MIDYVPVTVLAHPTIADMLKRGNITGDADIRACPDVAENHAVVTRNGRVESVFLWDNGWHTVDRLEERRR